MNEEHKIRIGITQGDINGIGYEIILKTFSEPEIFELCTPIVYGSPKLAAYHKKVLELTTQYNTITTASEADYNSINIINCNNDEVHIELGVSSKESGKAAHEALERAVNDYKSGEIDVLVTAPINKDAIQDCDFNFPGHTEFLQERMNDEEKALMILCCDNLRIALATTHIPLRDVATTITSELLEEKITIFNHSLKKDFNIDAPKIAVFALNPHAGDNGIIGNEEEEIIKPVIEKLSKEGVLCYGPFPADGFMGSSKYLSFDGILAMYHDQGLAPMKALGMENGVNFTAGLSIVRTSPAHGVAYDIAGKGEADENSFRQAIYTAIDIYRNRKRYEYAYRNPLRKQYFEKRDDSNHLNLQQTDNE